MKPNTFLYVTLVGERVNSAIPLIYQLIFTTGEIYEFEGSLIMSDYYSIKTYEDKNGFSNPYSNSSFFINTDLLVESDNLSFSYTSLVVVLILVVLMIMLIMKKM